MDTTRYNPIFEPFEILFFMNNIGDTYKITKGKFIKFYLEVDYESLPFCKRYYYMKSEGMYLKVLESNLFRTKDELLDSFK